MTDRLNPPGRLLLVTLDRLPAWIVPAFGCTWAAMPALDDLAGRGLALDRVLAGSDDPYETLAALAGRGPGDRDGWPLLDAAAAEGWSPAVATDDEPFAERLPGSITVRCLPPAASPRSAGTEGDTDLGRLFAAAVALAAEPSRRLIWCHAAGLGVAWDAPQELREAFLDPDDPPPPPGAAAPRLAVTSETDPDLVAVLRQVFAGQLTLLDRCLGRLLAAVDAGNPDTPWTVVVAGVRGLPLGLHGLVGPLPLPPFGELIQIPAVLVDRQGRMAAQRYGGLLLPADLGATLVELVAGGPSPSDDPRAGRSLTPLLDDWHISPRDRAISIASQGVAVATPAWHLVLPRTADGTARPSLYAKPDDYFEICDVADRCPDVVDELAQVASLATVDPRAAWTIPLSAPAVDRP